MNIREFTKTYAVFRDLNEAEAERIKNSSECRKYILKNINTASPENLLKAMATCIYDLTGDSVFRDQVYEGINRRFNNEDIN
jgi:hypothetical protein